MQILDDISQLQALIDENTLEKVENAHDYVTRTRDGALLMAFRWQDSSSIILHTATEEMTLWAENPEVRQLAAEIDGTGKEELFQFFVTLSAEDLKQLNALDDRIVTFEEELFSKGNLKTENFKAIHQYRKEVWNNKRYFEKMELLTDELMAADSYFLFLDKRYDKLLNHALRTQEYLDQIRQSYEAQVDIEQNSLMRFFTVVTSIFLPLTLLAGWYGMNLMMPEFKWAYGYPFVICLSVAIIGFMIWLFKKNKWL